MVIKTHWRQRLKKAHKCSTPASQADSNEAISRPNESTPGLRHPESWNSFAKPTMPSTSNLTSIFIAQPVSQDQSTSTSTTTGCCCCCCPWGEIQGWLNLRRPIRPPCRLHPGPGGGAPFCWLQNQRTPFGIVHFCPNGIEMCNIRMNAQSRRKQARGSRQQFRGYVYNVEIIVHALVFARWYFNHRRSDCAAASHGKPSQRSNSDNCLAVGTWNKLF